VAKTTKKQFTGQCNYCFKGADDLRKVRLRASSKEGWQLYTHYICGSCREYLIGNFKYEE